MKSFSCPSPGGVWSILRVCLVNLRGYLLMHRFYPVGTVEYSTSPAMELNIMMESQSDKEDRR